MIISRGITIVIVFLRNKYILIISKILYAFNFNSQYTKIIQNIPKYLKYDITSLENCKIVVKLYSFVPFYCFVWHERTLDNGKS